MRQFLAGDEVVALFQRQLVVLRVGLLVAPFGWRGGGGARVYARLGRLFGFFDGFFGEALRKIEERIKILTKCHQKFCQT